MIYYWEKTPTYIRNTIIKLLNTSPVLKPNDKKKKYSYLVIGSGFDIETTTIVSGNFVTAYCYHWQMSFNTLTIGGRSLITMKEFFEFLLSVIPDNKRLLVPDANLGFEYSFCKHYWNMFGITEFFSKNKRNPLKIVISDKIELREVLGLFGRNLESIANSFSTVKKLKGDLDYTLMRFSNTPLTEKEKEYCENDVQILSQLCYYIFNNYFGDKMDLPLTAISELRQMIKNKMGEKYFQIVKELRENMPDADIYYKLRNYLFKGGLCGTNSIYMDRLLKDVGSADLTSDYPACMNHYTFPNGKIIPVAPEDFLSLENKPYIACIEFTDLKSKTPHSILSIHKALDYDKKVAKTKPDYYIIDNGRVFYAKKITYILNDIDFKSVIQAYKPEEIEIKWCLQVENYIRLPHYVLEVLNEQYLIKEQLKSKDLQDTVEYMFSKNKVNGCFGMMCTALYCDEFVINSYTDEIEPKKVNGEVFKKEYKEAIKSVFLNPLWGMWITSYARSILIDAITKFPHCIIQYDTDSLYYYNKHPESKKLVEYLQEYNKHIKELNNKLFDGNKHFETLGTWDIESEPLTHFKGLGSKRYMYRQYSKKKQKYIIKSTVAGCPKGVILEQYEDIFGKVETEMQIKKFFDYFHDGLEIDEKHSKKLRPAYIDEYKGMHFADAEFTDYLGNKEKVKLTSATALLPTTFKLGLSDAHIRFYLTIQNEYNNTPKGISKIYSDLLSDIDIVDIFEPLF